MARRSPDRQQLERRGHPPVRRIERRVGARFPWSQGMPHPAHLAARVMHVIACADNSSGLRVRTESSWQQLLDVQPQFATESSANLLGSATPDTYLGIDARTAAAVVRWCAHPFHLARPQRGTVRRAGARAQKSGRVSLLTGTCWTSREARFMNCCSACLASAPRRSSSAAVGASCCADVRSYASTAASANTWLGETSCTRDNA